MSEKLILRLSSQSSSSIPWLVWSQATKEVIVSGELEDQSHLSVLTEYAKGRSVTVLVDSADVRLHRHFMPRKPTRQLLKALPFMLEDELAEDIERLHFSIEQTGYDKEQNQYWVNIAIVKRELLQSWLTLLSEVNITVKSMLPDVLCLPNLTEQADQNGKSISLLEYANGWLVREDSWRGAFISASWLPMYFDKLTAAESQSANTQSTNTQSTNTQAANTQQTVNNDESDVVETAPSASQTQINVNYFSALPSELTASLIESERVSLHAAEPELPMLLLAQQAEHIKWNLLQGEFAQKKTVSKNWMTWRPAAALLVITIVIQFVMVIGQWQAASSQLETAKAELGEMYKKAFPKEKLRMNILRTQLKRKVAAVGGDSSTQASGFIEFMHRLTPTFKKHNNTSLDSIRYDDKRSELRLNASAPSFQQFELFKNDIVKLGFQVNQGAVNNEGNKVTGSLSIQEAQ